MTFNGEIKGTPGFMAPEQIEKGGQKDQSSDIYALGAVLYAICMYKLPIEGTLDDILDNTVKGKIEAPTDLPEGLSAVIMRALELKKDNRYSTVTDLKSDLQKYMMGYSTIAEEAGIVTEIKLFMNRNKVLSRVVLGATLLIIILSVLFISHLQDKNNRLQLQAENLKIQTNEAIAAKDIADKSEERAKYVAEQFEQEQNKYQEISEQLEKQYWSETVLLQDEYIYKHPVKSINDSLKSINKLLELNPENELAKIQLVYCKFLIQDFHAVNKLYDPNIDLLNDLYPVAKEFSKHTKPGKLLPFDKLDDFFMTFTKRPGRRNALMAKMLAYDVEKREGEHNYLNTIKAVFRVWNPKWDGSKFNYDRTQSRLSIFNPQLKLFRSKAPVRSSLCPLQFMKITHLSLRNSGVYDLSQIAELKIQSLDIRDTKVINLKPIQQMSQLTSLTVNNNQFTEKQLSVIPKNVTIHKK